MNLNKGIFTAALLLVLLAGCGGGGGGNSSEDTTHNTNPGTTPGTAATVVLAANDLGMHCMDREFSVFSILPPFNVVNAQVLYRGPTGLPRLLDDTQVDVRYGGVSDADGSINTYSAAGPVAKTDFWVYADQLFGTSLNPGEGLTGLYMPGDDPLDRGAQPVTYNPAEQWFAAEGIPITPVDDGNHTNSFGMLRIRALDTGGQTLGHLDVD